MKVNLFMGKLKEWAFLLVQMVLGIKVNGRIAFLKAKEKLYMLIFQHTKEVLWMGRNMEKDVCFKMDVNIWVNLKMINYKERQSLKLIMGRLMMANGKVTNKMALDNTNGLMEIVMLETIKMVDEKVME